MQPAYLVAHEHAALQVAMSTKLIYESGSRAHLAVANEKRLSAPGRSNLIACLSRNPASLTVGVLAEEQEAVEQL